MSVRRTQSRERLGVCNTRIQVSRITERELTRERSTSSISIIRRNDLEPRKHNRVDRNNEKEILVLMKVAATDTAIPRFSAIISDRRLKNNPPSRPTPPWVEKTRGVNDPFSTSSTRSLYFLFFIILLIAALQF